MKRIKFLIGLFLLLSQMGFCQEPEIDYDSDHLGNVDKLLSVELHDSNFTTPKYEQRNLDVSFKNNYKSSEFDYDRVVVKKERKPRTEKRKKSNPFTFNFPYTASTILAYIIISLIIVVILYFVVKNANFSMMRLKKTKIKLTELEEEYDLDKIDPDDYARLIQNAKEKKDYRVAIRYYYLWLLKKLSDRKWILWNLDKTDSQFYLELDGKPIQQDFSRLLYLYDYIWFGEYQIDEVDFNQSEKMFMQTFDKI